MSIEQTIIPAPSLRLRFALTLRQTYDVLLMMGVALLLPVVLLIPLPPLRIPLGLALALFAPGYAATLAAFPRYSDIDGITRGALSFGLSAASMPILAIILDRLPWGIRPWPMAVSLSIWIILCCGIALGRRYALLAAAPLSILAPKLRSGRPGGRPTFRRLPSKRLIAVMLVLAGACILGARLFIRDPLTRTTEFYILGQEGRAEDYPRTAVVGEELQVTMSIINQEYTDQTYRVQVWVMHPWAPDERVFAAEEGPLTMESGQQQTWDITWQMAQPGDDQVVEFLLFNEADSEPYRTLRLWIDVDEQLALP